MSWKAIIFQATWRIRRQFYLCYFHTLYENQLISFSCGLGTPSDVYLSVNLSALAVEDQPTFASATEMFGQAYAVKSVFFVPLHSLHYSSFASLSFTMLKSIYVFRSVYATFFVFTIISYSKT